MKASIFLVAALSVLVGTNCTRSVTITAQQPAPISVPQHIQTIAIINRTLPESKVANIIEGVLTGEMPFQDRQAIDHSLNSLYNSLSESSRFRVVRTNVLLKGSGSGGILPAPLDWAALEKIAQDNASDAVLALETFDSDFIVTNAEKFEEKKDEKGNVVRQKYYAAQGVATIKLGLRLYDVKNRTITDQHQYSHGNTFTARGNTVAEAAAGLLARQEAINRVSAASGFNYGKRITPSWVYLRREFYKKKSGNPDLARGSRKASVNDWNGAITDWQSATFSSNQKVAGRAAHNIAVAYEVLGDFDNAVRWAQKSYADYGFKKGMNYTNVLQNRIRQQQLLNQQLGNN